MSPSSLDLDPEPLAPVSPRRRAILIVRARRSKRPEGEAALQDRSGKGRVSGVVQALAALGIDAKVRVAPRRKDATRQARAAARSGTELVVAAGGDRTVAAVARGLLHSQTVLGIVPLGAKRNAVAARLGVPGALEAACELLARGAARAVDGASFGATARDPQDSPIAFVVSSGEAGEAGEAAPHSGGGLDDGWWGGPPRTQHTVRRSTPVGISLRPGPARGGTPARLPAHPTALLVIARLPDDPTDPR